RLGGEGPRDLEPRLLGQRQVGGHHLLAAREPDPRDRRMGALAGLLEAEAGEPADGGVLEHRHVAEGGDVLEGLDHARAADAVRRHAGELGAVEDDRAGVGADQPRDLVEDGGLAGAVGADQPDDLALGDVEGHVVGRHQATESLAQAAHLEDRAHRLPPNRRKSESRPRGCQIPTAMSTAPNTSCDRPAAVEEKSMLLSSSIGMISTAPISGPATAPMPPMIVMSAARTEMPARLN